MSMSFFQVPTPINEPIKSYAPNSVEKKLLKENGLVLPKTSIMSLQYLDIKADVRNNNLSEIVNDVNVFFDCISNVRDLKQNKKELRIKCNDLKNIPDYKQIICTMLRLNVDDLIIDSLSEQC